MLIPVAIGIILGCAIAIALSVSGMAKEKSSASIILVAIAAFYPVFAVEDGDLAGVVFHSFIMLLFVACAWAGFLLSATIVAFAMIAHGMFDLIMLLFESPAPVWWPTFCASVDIVLGIWWYWYNRLVSWG